MRSLESREGKSAKSFVSQLPLLEFSWVGDSLLEGSTNDDSMAARPSGGIAASEEGVVTRC